MATFDFLGYFCNKKIFLSTEILVSNSSTLELKIKVIEKKRNTLQWIPKSRENNSGKTNT